MTKSRQEWLAQRRELLTASDVAAVLGAHPYRGPLAVYAEKVLGDEQPDSIPMRWGRRLEGVIAEAYAEETGRHVRDLGATEIQIHPDLPWLGATLDRVTSATPAAPAPVEGKEEGGEVPVELKSVGGRDAMSAGDWAADPPLHYTIQVQIQIACRGSSTRWGVLAGLLPGYRLAHTDLIRNDEFLEAAYPVLEAFWQRVQRHEPPPADETRGTIAAVKRLWPDDSGETIPLSHEDLALVQELEALRSAARETNTRIKTLEAQLRARLQDATFGALPDGRMVSLKTQRRQSYTVAESTYRVLRIVKGK